MARLDLDGDTLTITHRGPKRRCPTTTVQVGDIIRTGYSPAKNGSREALRIHTPTSDPNVDELEDRFTALLGPRNRAGALVDELRCATRDHLRAPTESGSVAADPGVVSPAASLSGYILANGQITKGSSKHWPISGGATAKVKASAPRGVLRLAAIRMHVNVITADGEYLVIECLNIEGRKARRFATAINKAGAGPV